MKRTFLYAVEADPIDYKYLIEIFERANFQVGGSSLLSSAFKNIQTLRPDIVLVERVLPEGDGLELCKQMRQSLELKGIPILIVTKKSDPLDEIAGLRAGADDYVAKPVTENLLLARVEALLRRTRVAEPQAPRVLRAHGIQLDLERHECQVEGRPVVLWPKEFELLKLLLQFPGHLLERSQLAENIWGVRPEGMAGSRTIDVTVERLRKKLGSSRDAIETVRGYGFRLKAS